MEEYIRMLLSQVRFEKAHKAIGDEIRAHIEEQTEANILDGMDRVTAEKRAVEDMGDPIEVGMSLDKIHRPQIAWSMFIAAMTIGAIGAMIRMAECDFLQDSDSIGTGVFWGISLMLIVFLVDYTAVLKYARVIAAALILWFIWYPASYRGNFTRQGIATLLAAWYPYFRLSSIVYYTEDIRVIFTTLLILFIPLYSGIIYKYRGQSYKGLLKAVLWIFVPCAYMIFEEFALEPMHAAIIVLSLLTQLTIAIKKGWFGIPKKRMIVPQWGIAFAYFYLIFADALLYSDSSSRVENIRKALGRAKPFGCGVTYISFKGKNEAVAASSYIGRQVGEEFVLPYICADWGLVIGLAVIVGVLGLIAFGFIALSKTKNQPGVVMGSGCLMWLLANAVANMLAGFGLIDTAYVGDTFFPFISGSNVFISYIFLGIILSIYKYKDAYSQHIDSKVFSGLKKKIPYYGLNIRPRKEVKEEKGF